VPFTRVGLQRFVALVMVLVFPDASGNPVWPVPFHMEHALIAGKRAARVSKLSRQGGKGKT